ncbi:Dcr-2.2 family protein [Megaselia abdita]
MAAASGHIDSFKARDYQTKLLEIALSRNSIIYLPTGSGKTFIAIQAIKRLSNSLKGEWGKGAQRTAFLCNSVALAEQQCDCLKMHLPDLKVKLYVGHMNLDNWKKSDWQTEFRENQVLVLTTQVLLDCIRHLFISLKDFNLLIFDECHHTTKKHPMHQLMEQFQYVSDKSKLPRVIGLTGVLIKSAKESSILNDLDKLESIFCGKIITVESMNEYKNVLVYSTCPKEIVKTFKEPTSRSETLEIINPIVNEMISYLENCDPSQQVSTKNMGKLRPPNPIKKIKSLFEDFLYHLKELGLYAGYTSITFVLIELEHKMKSSETGRLRQIAKKSMETCEFVKSLLVSVIFKHGLLKKRSLEEERKAILGNSSPKLTSLLEYLIQEFKYRAYADIKCLIFVLRRYTTKVMHVILSTYIGNDQNHIPLKTQFMVGKNQGLPEAMDDNLSDDNREKDVMAKFRRSDINCIICSSVLEEGIDVQECNYVIMFDEVKSFCAYVQTKGRARMQNSFYVIFNSVNTSGKLEDKLETFKSMDKRLKNYFVDRTIDRHITLPPVNDNVHKIKPYFSKIGARLEEDNVLQLLHRYLDCLPNDNYGNKNLENNLWKKLDAPYCRVSLQLPMQSTVTDTIVSEVMPNINAAKKSAAMKACIKLYENKELTDHLIPVSTEKVLEDLDDTYFPHWKQFSNEAGAGTKKSTNTYDKYFASEQVKALPQPLQISHLYEIIMNHGIESSNENKHLTMAFASESRFGILSSKLLPVIADFPLYLHQGNVTISIKLSRSDIFLHSSDHLSYLRGFHVMLFRDILKVVKTFMTWDHSNEENSFLLVPLVGQARINWDMVLNYQKLEKVCIPSLIEKVQKQYIASEWIGKVITPWYRNGITSSGYENHVVVKVHENLTPLSPFPESAYKSYKDYIERRYEKIVERSDTFMVEVKRISVNMKLFSRGVEKIKIKKKNKQENYTIMLIPEMCHNFKFPADLWIKCRLLPSILNRLHSLLVAEKLRTSINAFVGVKSIGYLPSNEGSAFDYKLKLLYDNSLEDSTKGSSLKPLTVLSDGYNVDFDMAIAFINQKLPSGMSFNPNKELKFKHSKDIRILKIKNPKSPEQVKLLHAITAAGAGDIFNMEQVEVLGDSFLKFATSLYLMHKFPHWNEGYLTSMKGKVVSNKNLLYLACVMDLNLPGMIISNPFEPTKNWIPPLISPPKKCIKMIKEHNLDPRTIDKFVLSESEVRSGICNQSSINTVLKNILICTEPCPPDYYHFINKQLVSDKVVADSVEAILGTTLQTFGIVKNFDVLRYFGIINREVVNPASVLKEKLVNSKIRANISNEEVDQFLINYGALEKKLNYKFKDRAYLLSALTHPSYPSNRITGCYQQLEFLGDAILDFLVTCYIFEQNPEMNPGKLTDLRSALVNNVTLGCISIRNQFHKHLLYDNYSLSQAIDNFEAFQKEHNYAITSEIRLLGNEDGLEQAVGHYVNVPKALGDVLEALVGAVFLDSNNDLERTWEFIYHILEDEIHQFTSDVPIQVVRQLYEFKGADPKFLDAFKKDGGFQMDVTFNCRGQRRSASGFGKNTRQAKNSAAKAALFYLL